MNGPMLAQVILWGAAFPALHELHLCGNHISDIQLSQSSPSQGWAEQLQVLSPMAVNAFQQEIPLIATL